MVRLSWWCFALSLGVVSAAAAKEPFVYISVAGEQRIAVYRADVEGKLNHVDNLKLDAEPGALALRPDRKWLGAALRSSGQLAALARDPASGKLALLNVVPAGPDPAHISLDATGAALFTAYYVAAKVTVHPLAADGKLPEMPQQSLTTAEKAHAIVQSPDRKFFYVPHTGAEAVFQFAWNSDKRELSPLDPPQVKTAAGTGPRHLAFHPKAPIAYVVNEQGNTVTMYRGDSAGQLKPEHTEPTLPANHQGANSTAEIRVHPSGKYLYCANRGHDSIARFSLGDDFKPKFLGATPTEKTPRSFDVDPDGEFLYAAGEEAGKVACYRIDATNGELHRLATVDVGRQPWWVM